MRGRMLPCLLGRMLARRTLQHAPQLSALHAGSNAAISSALQTERHPVAASVMETSSCDAVQLPAAFPTPSLLQLTLTYNRTRQASITTELIEIIR